MKATAQKLLSAALALTLLSPPADALEAASGGDETALFELDQMLKAETTVASARAKNIRETPGIVTVVTRQEILDSGARDLTDVLRMIPGFQLGGDQENTIGVGFRGNWGQEGKVLFLLDGLELNEILYGTYTLGNRIPVDQIQTVEVIRGPGSALYGGFAELAVVRITTRGAADLKGLSATGQAGTFDGAFSRWTLSAGYGQTFGDVSVAAKGFVGQGTRSAATYPDATDPAFNFAMAPNSSLDPLQLNLSAVWKGLELRFFYDDYGTNTKDGYGQALYTAERVRYRTLVGDGRYEIPLADHLTLTPRVTYAQHVPWQATQIDPGCSADPALEPARCPSTTYFDQTGQRITGRLTLVWEASPGLGIMAGVTGYQEQAWQNDPGVPDQYLFYEKTSIELWDAAAYAEIGWDNPIANVLAGARYEWQTHFGSSFVPRVALTKLFAPFHAKLLYSMAYKAPLVENIAVAAGTPPPDIKPERTQVLEAELGWQISDFAYLAANVYDVVIDDAIIYTAADYGAGPVDVYQNYARTGTIGAEAELRLKGRWGSATVGYSFYTAGPNNQVDLYQVPGHGSLMLGFAAQKATATAAFRVGSFTIAPALLFLSDRYGYQTQDPNTGEATGLTRFGPSFYLDLFVTWRDVLAKGLDLGAGVYDILDTATNYIQPYSGGHPALPGPGREYLVRLSFNQGG